MAHPLKKHHLDSMVVGLTTIDIPIVSGAFALITVIALPVILITKRRQAKRELNVMWQLADRLGYTADDLKKLSGQSNFGSIDWELTRPGKSQTIVPSLEAIQIVLTRLKAIDQP